jgi:hypothetical protein
MRSAALLATAPFAAALLVAAPAFAQETAGAAVTADTANMPTDSDYEEDPTIPGALVIGAEVGAIFPQPFSELNTHVAFGLELGYRLPFAEERVEIMFDAGFSPPKNSFTLARSEGGATYEGKLTEQELHFSLGPRFHVMERSSPWNFTIALGPRLYFLRSWSNGSRDGKPFAEFYEENAEFGLFVALGGEYILGPGALFLDIDFGWSDLDHKISGDANTGNITPTIGYRFFLL